MSVIKSNKLTKRIKKGVNVVVISGKFKGRKALIKTVDRRSSIVLLDGIFYSSNIEISADGSKTMTEKCLPISVSNVLPV
ncbi:KOW motif domain-containing protein [Candidatus Deianiraea vastatrix]|uniref:50S ribosomal protein L24 n=1 Tax=Candidatus Deianiraea vastatrix TaxID=2163644 RepID=A0A5B8XCU2_9RICK|nr:KOW motif domain-containing protein [Candidatus Deianiraea vastatrix]QED23199.1 50S ribosomal protein L24 [Candidatus Deianiraea vastatrix]